MVLTAITQYPSAAYAGLIEGLADGKDIESYFNNAGDTAGVYLLTPTVANTHTYTVTIYGIPVSFTSGGSATAGNVQAGILAAIAAITALTPLVTAAASGPGNVLITEVNPENGPASIGGLDGDLALSTSVAHSQTEPMPAGIFILRGPNFQDARLPRASGTSLLIGGTVHQHAPVNEKQFPPPSTVLYPPNHAIPVMKRGKLWMPVEQSVALTDTPFFRFAAGSGGTQLGAVRKDSDSGTAQSLSGIASFKQPQSVAGGVALLQINIVP